MDPLTKDAVPQVGPPDEELKNSPIIDEAALEDEAPGEDLEIESGVCYFNGESFAIGQLVRSGDELLECSGRGVWVRRGEKRPQ